MNMQRVYKLMLLKQQAAQFLKNAESSTVVLTRTFSGPVLPLTETKPTEPYTLFLCDSDGLVPISEDADQIYRDNKSSIEHHEVRQLLPPLPAYQGRCRQKSRVLAECMSDRDGLISAQHIRLSMAEQIKTRLGTDQTALLSVADPGNPSQVNVENRLDDSSSSGGDNNQDKDSNLPTPQQLDEIKTHITKLMPEFFDAKSHQYNFYSQDIVFENNYWGKNKISRGISRYGLEILKLRTKCNFAYCNINMYIINITANPEDGSVRVRWSMKGLPQLQGLLFWKWNLFNLRGKGGLKEKMKGTFVHHDGFNIFWVNKSGAIYRHRLDRVMPDEPNKAVNTSVDKLAKILNKKLATTRSSAHTNHHSKT